MESLSKQELGERLRQARTASGITQETAAAKLGVSRPILIALEKGLRVVTSAEVVKLADLYKVAVGRLLSPNAIHVDFAARFRSHSSLKGVSDDRLRSMVLLSKLATSSAEIESALGIKRTYSYPPELRVVTKKLDQQAEDSAIQFRQRLGIGGGPISDLAALLEIELGIWIFVRPLAPKVSGVFGYDEKIGACILVNSKHPRERRQLTIAHETGHFVAFRAFVEVTAENEDDSVPEERFAKSFSYALLMPATGVRQKFLELSQEGRKFTPRDLIVLAHLYSVSPEAMCRRLEDLELLPEGMWESLKRRGFSGAQVRVVLGDRPVDEAFNIPPRLGAMIADVYERGLYSEGQLCERFELERVEFRKLVAAFSAEI